MHSSSKIDHCLDTSTYRTAIFSLCSRGGDQPHHWRRCVYHFRFKVGDNNFCAFAHTWRTLISRTSVSSKDCTSSVYFFWVEVGATTDHVCGPKSGDSIHVQELSCSQQHLLPFQGLHRDDLSYIQQKIQDTRDARQDPPTFQCTNLPLRPIDTTLPTWTISTRDGQAEQSPVADITDRDCHQFTAVGSTKQDRTLSYYY